MLVPGFGTRPYSRDVSLSTLVLPHASSSPRTGRDGADVAEASSVCISPDRTAPGVLERVRRDRVLLPRWPGRVWFLDLISLLDGHPLELLVRRDILFQAGGSIFHPQPELCKLWAWHLRGPSSKTQVSQPRLLRPFSTPELPPREYFMP